MDVEARMTILPEGSESEKRKLSLLGSFGGKKIGVDR
jgi:hypothetical protein